MENKHKSPKAEVEAHISQTVWGDPTFNGLSRAQIINSHLTDLNLY